MTKYTEEEIEDRIDDWHDGAGEDQSLAQYLGMTDEEYRDWAEGPIWVSAPGETMQRDSD